MTVEIATDRLRRLQPCLQAITDVANGEVAVARQHRHLDAAGDVEFALQLLPFGGVAADLVQLLADRIACAFQRARHHPDLVAARIVRHRPVEFAIGEVARTGRELGQRHGDPPGQSQYRQRRQQCDQATDQAEHAHRAVQPGQHRVAAHRKLQGPAAAADRLQHRIADRAVARVGMGELQRALLHARGFHRGEVAATGTRDVARQVMGEGDTAFRMHGDRALRCEQRGPLAGDRAQRFQRRRQRLHRHVQADHADAPGTAVAQRQVERGHVAPAGGFVEIRLRPPRRRRLQRALVPLAPGQVVTVGEQVAIRHAARGDANVERQRRTVGQHPRFQRHQATDRDWIGIQHRFHRLQQLGAGQGHPVVEFNHRLAGHADRAHRGVQPIRRLPRLVAGARLGIGKHALAGGEEGRGESSQQQQGQQQAHPGHQPRAQAGMPGHAHVRRGGGWHGRHGHRIHRCSVQCPPARVKRLRHAQPPTARYGRPAGLNFGR